MQKPTSILALDEKTGYASVQIYDKDQLLSLAKLPPNSSRQDLKKRLEIETIFDPLTRLRLVTTAHNAAMVAEINKNIIAYCSCTQINPSP